MSRIWHKLGHGQLAFVDDLRFTLDQTRETGQEYNGIANYEGNKAIVLTID